MLNPSPSVFFFVALSAEAKPIIRAWQLKKCPESSPFEVYLNADTVLVVSGLGKVAMAGAVAYTLSRYPALMPVLLNVGIAGHPDLPLASLRIADKLLDAETGKVFYPQFVGLAGIDSLALKTWPRPHSEYDSAFMFDMEATGFYEMAVKFGSNELIHCLKVISDNNQNRVDAVDAQQVTQWIENSVPQIQNVVQQLQRLRESVVDGIVLSYPSWITDMHFTVSQANQLQMLLKRRALLNNVEDWPEQGFKNAKLLLGWLEQQLDAFPFSL